MGELKALQPYVVKTMQAFDQLELRVLAGGKYPCAEEAGTKV